MQEMGENIATHSLASSLLSV